MRDGWAYGLAASMQHDPCGIVSECANRLSDWNKRCFGHVQLSIKSKQKTLQILQSRFDGSTCDEQRVLREKIKELLTREELMWKQRSRVQWLREGDMNARFFHSRASNRCYFLEIFSSSSPQDCESAVNDIDRSMTDNERQALERRVTSSEAYEALMQMDPSKAPGPDGMTALFYQKIWCFTGHVTPTRGLRQGDPISPYIFVMCAEELSSLVRKSVTEGHIHGVKVCRGAPEISHMSLTIKKSEISFSANVDIHTRTRIIECLNVREVVHQDKYLGLPSVIGRSKKVVFEAILDKIKKKLGGWKEKTLSIAEKEVLIKSVAQAMPMYIMNIFLLPGNIINDIHKSLNAYWVGDGVKENPIWWSKWERMCISKFRGGLGFRHLGLFNRSLLAKQVWRLITSPTTLAARILKARYFPRSSFFDAKIGYRPSYVWRSFLSVKDIVRKGCKWNIGNGRSVNVWNDFRVDDHRNLGPKPNNCDVYQVRDLLNLEGDGWNHELLSSLFPHNITSKIAYCFVSKSRNDVLYWHNSPGGRFSCRFAYLLALEVVEDMVRNTICDDLIDFWCVVWKARVPSKVKLFMWRAWNNYLPTIDNLQSRGLNQTSSCTHCGETTENIVNVLFKCSAAKELRDPGIWTQLGCSLRLLCKLPLEAEAKAVHWAMSHALSRGYSALLLIQNHCV
ncbi:reverse transcriptase [Tanacetum coccineum]